MATLFEARFYGEEDWQETHGVTPEMAAENFVSQRPIEAKAIRQSTRSRRVLVEIRNPWNNNYCKAWVEKKESATITHSRFLEAEPCR